MKLLQRRKRKERDTAEIDRNLPGAGDDMLSYKNMMLAERRWANTGSGWRMVGGWIIITFITIGACALLMVLQRGWDGLFQVLGWK